jgi:hypothetical protein
MAVYDGKVWFGNQRYGTWIKAPLADMDASANGFSSEQTFNNGGSFIKSSFGAAKSYDLSWNGDIDELQVIKNFKDGIYGGGLLYWEDPFAKNILPPHWAAPMLTVRDWPSLISSDNKPIPVTETTSGKNFPYQSAKYDVYNTAETSRSLTILIPEEHFLQLGFCYSATGTAGIKLVPILYNGTEGATVTLTQKAYNDSIIYDGSYGSYSNITGAPTRVKAVRIYIAKTDATPSTITIRGGIATYHVSTTVAGHGHVAYDNSAQYGTAWSAGQGATGCVMADSPSIEYKNIVGNTRLIKMSTKLKEVEAWL